MGGGGGGLGCVWVCRVCGVVVGGDGGSGRGGHFMEEEGRGRRSAQIYR